MEGGMAKERVVSSGAGAMDVRMPLAWGSEWGQPCPLYSVCWVLKASGAVLENELLNCTDAKVCPGH